jgi:uncharacterized membrane protein
MSDKKSEKEPVNLLSALTEEQDKALTNYNRARNLQVVFVLIAIGIVLPIVLKVSLATLLGATFFIALGLFDGWYILKHSPKKENE